MRHWITSTLTSLVLLAVGLSSAKALPFDINTATGLFTPSFRGDANTTYLGWDVFGEPGDTVLNDTTPDLGTDGGSFVTTNGENHQSGSLNYYSGSGSIAEDVSFATNGTGGSGFTTVIVQAKTLFGALGEEIAFGPIDGVFPSQVVQGDNAAGGAQLFVRYELPGAATTKTFSMTSGPFSFMSFGEFIVDTVWSPTSFAVDTAIVTPEPSAALLSLLGLSLIAMPRRLFRLKRGEQ